MYCWTKAIGVRSMHLRFIPWGLADRTRELRNIDSGIFYAADRSTGLVTVANISDPKNPKPIENFVGNPGRIAISKGA